MNAATDTMGTKWLAGTLLGLPLAVLLCTLSILWLPGGWETGIVAAVVACLPVWVTIISCSLLFRTSRSAWLWLGGANLLGFGALWALRLAGLAPAALPVS
ncbi:hypothetical protein Tamer19_35150 [Cupriavidus sp. TA19]|uniref:hypothetical protein n=1 Tax=unclassified Cupriavidus TaxID=2640874 RepID=UPI000E2EF66B|nr:MULTISPECIES: hypothetical protein [unclassified Cupriavidus]BDB23921.1 hypothetical protein CTP10_R12630 [Cupriavidus sp. P-10]GLC94107.1 hypothetical protein Tamer19_35150 [Cupriavidus sp. TA19]